MMIEAITPDKLYLILPFKVSQLAVLMADKFGISTKETLLSIYRSNTYRQLENEKTKLWFGGIARVLYGRSMTHVVFVCADKVK